MEKLFYENGEQVPHEEMTILVLQSVQKWRSDRENELIDQIRRFVDSHNDCTDDDAKMLINEIKAHDKNVPFGNS